MTYDISCGVYSSDGTVQQIQYAQKCADNQNLAMASLTKDGSVACVTKLQDNKLIIQEEYNIYKYGTMVAVLQGLQGDTRKVADLLNQIYTNNYENFREEISIQQLTSQIAMQMEQYTHYDGVRPYAVNIIIMNQREIYTVYPSGQWTSNYAITVGNKKKTIFEGLEEEQQDGFNHLKKMKNQGGRTKTFTQQEGLQMIQNVLEQVMLYDETGVKLNNSINVEYVSIDKDGIKIWRDKLVPEQDNNQ